MELSHNGARRTYTVNVCPAWFRNGCIDGALISTVNGGD